MTEKREKKEITLYWSSMNQYEECPQNFLWSRGWGDIDLGNGPGKPKTPPSEQSEHSAFMGTVIQAVLELFYNEQWFKLDPDALGQKLSDEIDKVFEEQLYKHHIIWSESDSKADMMEIVKNGVFGFMKTFKANKLLGPYAKSEVPLYARTDTGVNIGGRLDFVIQKEDGSVYILDGKNSRTKGLYTNPDQLRFYALLFYLSSGILPAKLGFIYYRYPYGYLPPEDKWPVDALGIGIKPEPLEGIDWVEYSTEDLQSLSERVLDVKRGLDQAIFPPKPKPSMCKWCAFERVCEARQDQKALNRQVRKKKPEDEDLLKGVIIL
jgi:CRISPR/Cas system-associated exonuclease Cas4 (RecB family)